MTGSLTTRALRMRATASLGIAEAKRCGEHVESDGQAYLAVYDMTIYIYKFTL